MTACWTERLLASDMFAAARTERLKRPLPAVTVMEVAFVKVTLLPVMAEILAVVGMPFTAANSV